MALIKCPECGKEVSDKAKACIHCGSPMNVVNGKIKIKCGWIDGSIWKAKIVTDDGRELAKIPQGGVASFSIEKDEHVTVSWRLKSVEGTLEYEGCNSYEITVVGFFQRLALNKVDHIDSED